MTTENIEKTDTVCMITLVTPGYSDRVIKVTPAEHTEEKIWLDNTPGIERWENIKRLINNHASRFSPIPEPAPWCGDNKDLKTITLKPSDIPTVKLENFVLPAPPKEDTRFEEKPQLTEKQWDERFNKLEETVNKLADILVANSEVVTEKRGPGRPKHDKTEK